MNRRPIIVASLVCFMATLALVAQNEGLHGVVLDRETGQPVAASKVTVVHVLDPTGREKQSGVNSITVMTEDDGSYHIPKEKVDLIWSSKLILFGTAREYGFEAKRRSSSKTFEAWRSLRSPLKEIRFNWSSSCPNKTRGDKLNQ